MLMPCHGLLVIFSKPDRLDPNTCAFSQHSKLPLVSKKSHRPVILAEEKTQLIG
jgi:hypothetical protein